MLSAIVLTKNEEKNIGECLKSLSFCDEKIVIDDHSDDRTAGIVKKAGARIFRRALDGDFAAQRNYGLEKAKGDWVFFIDADERVSPALAKEILKRIKKDKFAGFYFHRQDIIFGKKLNYGETNAVRLIRLAKKNSGTWQRRVHETWQVAGEVGEIEKPLLHYPHATITDFLTAINFYSSLHARVLFESGRKTSLPEIVGYPAAKFVQGYLVCLGFLDGMPGLIVALMMSLHSFLARGKLYLLWQKKS